MAHKRKDTLVTCKEWAKHLKPYGKRVQAKAERRAAVADILCTLKEEMCKDQDFELASKLRDLEREVMSDPNYCSNLAFPNPPELPPRKHTKA